jgi:hypothetical protein
LREGVFFVHQDLEAPPPDRPPPKEPEELIGEFFDRDAYRREQGRVDIMHLPFRIESLNFTKTGK